MFRQILIFLFSISTVFGAPSSKKTVVLVSIPPYQTIAQKIGGDSIEVMVVVPASHDPHTYEPTAKQMEMLRDAKIWFQIGEPFENKMAPLLQIKKINLLQGVDLIHESDCGCHSDVDRHVWLSPKQMALQAKKIKEALIQMCPEHSDAFEKRWIDLEKELNETDQSIRDKLSSLKTRTFVVSHPAFAYFCKDYDLQQLSIEKEGKDLRPKELQQLLKDAKKSSAKVAIVMPQHSSRGAELVAKNLNLTICSIDPYSAHYIETFNQLSSALDTK